MGKRDTSDMGDEQSSAAAMPENSQPWQDDNSDYSDYNERDRDQELRLEEVVQTPSGQYLAYDLYHKHGMRPGGRSDPDRVSARDKRKKPAAGKKRKTASSLWGDLFAPYAANVVDGIHKALLASDKQHRMNDANIFVKAMRKLSVEQITAINRHPELLFEEDVLRSL